MALAAARKVIVIGGSGALGRALVQSFRPNWEVTSVDISPNLDAQCNIAIKAADLPEFQARTLLSGLQGKYEAILCVAGGFVAGSVGKTEVFAQTQNMFGLNVNSSLLTAHIATKHLAASGLLLFTGAATPFKSTTPDLLAYALAKTAVHSLASNLAERTDIPADSTVVTILPETLDTPRNRTDMPEADVKKWLQPGSVAALVKMWAEGENRPENGSFAVVKKEAGCAVPEFL